MHSILSLKIGVTTIEKSVVAVAAYIVLKNQLAAALGPMVVTAVGYKMYCSAINFSMQY
jgi:hypothetical protein